MAAVEICTQMLVPAEYQALADTLSIQENPLNGRQITTGAPIQGGGDPASLALPIGSMWQNGRKLRVKLLNGSDKIKDKIRQYASLWTLYANIKLQFVDSGDAEIRVNVDSSGSSWSYVGTGCLAIPSNRPTMNFGWLTDSTAESEFSRVIVHEFGHALGCIHEHQSPAASIPWDKKAVYEYYKRTNNWDPEAVDRNIFQLYSASSTQFSEFDAASIMLYAIPSSLTTNGYSVGWNTQLSGGDKMFISQAYPGRDLDVSSFNTMEIRPWNQPRHDNSVRKSFLRTFASPPNMALGLNWLDIANSANIRVKAYADNITVNTADVHLDSWADTTLYSAGCTWFRAAANGPDFQMGQFSTVDDHPWNRPQEKTSRWIPFARPYSSPPKVVVWLSQLDMNKNKNWRAKATATGITSTGFTLNLDTWADTTLYMATASWIAYPSNKAGVESGTYNTQDIRPWNQPRLLNSGRVNFPPGRFQSAPKVLIALNFIDIDFHHNLRLKLAASSVSAEGMDWHLDSWADTILYAAGASYIAFT